MSVCACLPVLHVCICRVCVHVFPCAWSVRVCFLYACLTHSTQLQDVKQLERERHRQYSPVAPHTQPDSPQLQTHIYPRPKGLTQEVNGPVTPTTPIVRSSSTVASTPSTPTTPALEGSSRSVSGEQQDQGEQGPVYESPDPENGSDFCVVENEQTEADQATAAAQRKSASFLLLLYFILKSQYLYFLEPCYPILPGNISNYRCQMPFQNAWLWLKLFKLITLHTWFKSIEQPFFRPSIQICADLSLICIFGMYADIQSHSEHVIWQFLLGKDNSASLISLSTPQCLIHWENWCRIRRAGDEWQQMKNSLQNLLAQKALC